MLKNALFAVLLVMLIPASVTAYSDWHTFYGSSAEDRGSAIARDDGGNLYIAGISAGTWNGPNGESPLNNYSGGSDIYVLKLARNGSYLWHTFYGSGGSDTAYDIAVNGSSVYVTGFSMGSWNGHDGQAPTSGSIGLWFYWNIFVLKLDQNGAYQWHTFYGSVDENEGQSLVLDADENIYVTGPSQSSWNGPDGQHPLHNHTLGESGQPEGEGNNEKDIFVLKLNASAGYQWHTFYGSDYEDRGASIVLDSNNNIFVAGKDRGNWTGPDGQLPLHNLTGVWNDSGGYGWDMVIMKLNSSGGYQWHTYYGAANDAKSGEEGQGIAVDSYDNVYIAGKSKNSWNGSGGESPINAFSGGDEITVLKLNNSGGYQWHSFFGSSGNDYALAVALSESDNAYIAGRSALSWNVSDNPPLSNHSGGTDIFLLRINSTGGYAAHKFYGSASDDRGQDLLVNENEEIIAVGYSPASWESEGSTLLNNYTGGQDIVILNTSTLEPDTGDDETPDTGSSRRHHDECDSDRDCDSGEVCCSGDCEECCRDSDCDDGNECTDDNCDNNKCEYSDNANSCDDGDVCTRNDRCSAGSCLGTPITTGSCAHLSRLLHSPSLAQPYGHVQTGGLVSRVYSLGTVPAAALMAFAQETHQNQNPAKYRAATRPALRELPLELRVASPQAAPRPC